MCKTSMHYANTQVRPRKLLKKNIYLECKTCQLIVSSLSWLNYSPNQALGHKCEINDSDTKYMKDGTSQPKARIKQLRHQRVNLPPKKSQLQQTHIGPPTKQQ